MIFARRDLLGQVEQTLLERFNGFLLVVIVGHGLFRQFAKKLFHVCALGCEQLGNFLNALLAKHLTRSDLDGERDESTKDFLARLPELLAAIAGTLCGDRLLNLPNEGNERILGKVVLPCAEVDGDEPFLFQLRSPHSEEGRLAGAPGSLDAENERVLHSGNQSREVLDRSCPLQLVVGQWLGRINLDLWVLT